MEEDNQENKNTSRKKTMTEEDEDNDCETLIRQHKKIYDCSLMIDGYHSIKRKYYFCSCDPDCQMPLCSACLNKCHEEHWKSKDIRELITDKRNALCFCGLRNHILLEGNTKGDFVYDNECQFLEWSVCSNTYVYYEHENNDGEILCSFCYNSMATTPVGFIRKTNEKICRDLCCTKHHDDYLSIFEKIVNINKHVPFKFEGLRQMQFVNMIVMSRASFENSYHRMFNTLRSMENDLTRKKRVFDFTLYINNSPFMKALENLKTLLCVNKRLFYVSKIIDFYKFVIPLMLKGFNFKSQENVWILKSNIWHIFHKANFRKYFEPLPIFSLQDQANMHPFQRMIYSDYIKMFPDITKKLFTPLENEQKSYIDDLLSILDKFKSIKNKSEHEYNMLRIAYSQIKNVVRFNKFTNEQAMKMLTLNDDLIYSSISERSKEIINGHSQIKMLYQMSEVILYLAYNYNDTQLRKYLSKEIELNQISFFHGNNETSKMIYKNTAHILLYARTIHQKYVVEENNQIDENLSNTERMNKSESVMNNIKLKKNIEKLHDKIMFLATDINSLTLNYPDAYLLGLKRLLDNKMSIYHRLLDGQLTPKEQQIYDKLVQICRKLEENYQKFFEFQLKIKDLEESIIKHVKQIFEVLELTDNDFIHEDKDNKKNSSSNVINNNSIKANEDIEKFRKRRPSVTSKFPWSNKESSSTNEMRILINKTPLLFTVLKSFQILIDPAAYEEKDKKNEDESEKSVNDNEEENDEETSEYKISRELIETIFKFLDFYVKDSPDNCLFVITENVLNIFMNITPEYVHLSINLFEYIVKTLKTNNITLSQNDTLMNLITYYIEKISGKRNHLLTMHKLLKLISKLSKMNYLHQEHTLNLIRSHIKNIFLKNPIFHIFREIIIPPQDPNEENEKTLKEMIDGKEKIDDYNVEILCLLFTKLLKIINYLFDGNATLNEIKFLGKIFTKEQIPKILKDLTLYLPLRIQLIKFYRMTYIDIIIDSTKIKEYIKILSKDIKSTIDDNASNFILFQELLKVKESFYSPDTDSDLLNFEMKNFAKIVGYNTSSGILCKKETLLYFKEGIILPLSVFINTYISIIYNLDGYQYIKLHEMVLHFLKVKKYMIQSSLGSDKKVELRLSKNHIFKGFRASMNNRFSLSHFVECDLLDIEKDLSYIQSPDIEILNYKKLHEIFVRNAKNFMDDIGFESLSKFLCKRNGSFTDEDVKNKRIIYDEKKLFNDLYGQKIFDFVIKYEKDKHNFSESALGINLAEKNVLFDKTYRFIMLKPIFYLINRPNLYIKYRSQNLFHILKLLQYDTDLTQIDIMALIKEDSEKIKMGKKIDMSDVKEEEAEVMNKNSSRDSIDITTQRIYNYGQKERGKISFDLNYLINVFTENLLSIIFDSCNPSSLPGNEDYFVAYLIIKILKYLCEDHNLKFQTLFFKDVNIEYGADEDGVTETMNLFDLMMSCLDKILIFAKWDEVTCKTKEEDKIAFFYDIFFCMIELGIEMIQGTSRENIRKIIEVEGRQNENSFFYRFLVKAKSVLKNDSSKSKIVYKVRIDIINFVQAFLEEKNTPKKIVMLIENLITPFSIFDSILINLKKLYANIKDICIVNYDKFDFDEKVSKNFTELYFSDDNFSQNPEFELANHMYHYIKDLNNFNNKDAINIINCTKMYNDEQILNLKNDYSGKNNSEKNEENENLLIDKRYFQIYFCVKFFEAITRGVWVQGEDDKFPQPVLFTLDPTVLYLSENSKKSFIQDVPRDSRSSKLFALMEYTNYFVTEINQNKRRLSGSRFLRLLNLINYDWLDLIIFLIIAIINVIIFLTANTDNKDSGYSSLYNLILPFALAQFLLTFFAILCWFISKFTLYHTIELEKYYSSHRINREEELSFCQHVYVIIVKTILSHREIINFFWDFIINIIGICSKKNLFIFSLEILIIVNINSTLQNITKAIVLRYKQLLIFLMFLIVITYIFSSVAFFSYSKDFIHVLEGNQENACGSLFYCFLTHLEFGLRTDGGIGEFIAKSSFERESGYFMGMFFFQFIFYILIIVIMLAVIGGSVIDTFSELREKSRKDKYDMENVCFICSGCRNDIEKYGETFEEHTQNVHNIWKYVDYMIGLKFVDPQETNAINSFVIEQLQNKKISWFPSFTPKQEGKEIGEDEEEEVKKE